jgi:small basic protein (TIGR04137 family)
MPSHINRPYFIHFHIHKELNIMSLHRSLKGSSKIQVKRNVLKRYERINQLSSDGRWKAGDKVLGLPKTKVEE